MGIYEQADILAAGQALVPNWADQELQRKQAQANLLSAKIGQEQAMLGMEMDRYKLGAAQREEQRGIDEESRYRTALDEAMRNPDAGNISKLMMAHPKFAQEIKQAWDLKDEAARQKDLTQIGSIYSAAQGGRYDLATKQLRARIAADKAAGQDVADDEAILQALESPNEEDRKKSVMMIGSMLAAVTGPDHFGSVYGKVLDNSGDFTLGPGAKRFDASGRLIAQAEFAPRPLSVGEGQTVYEYRPGGAQGSVPVGGSRGTPRGLRNNNPGNLEFGPFAKKYGATGSDGRFAIFPSMEAGNRAQEALLSGKGYFGGGRKSINAIIGKYAPASDNNHVGNYSAYVARRVGVTPDAELTAEQIPAVAQAMREFENGQQVGVKKPPARKAISQAEYAKLPKGATYTAPDGSVRRKK